VLARHLGVQIYELDTADEDGDPRSPAERFSGLRIAQQFVSQTAGLLVFDEAEDILTGSMLQRGAASACKGWFNGQLETNPLPIIWIANSISELDPAAARRFDLILQMPVPSRTHRLRILRDGIGQLASPALIDRFSESRSLAPAVVARAAKVIRRIGLNLPEVERDGAITRVLNETLRAQGYQELKDDGNPALDPAVYDISLLNTRADLAGIASRLATSPSARLCLHGQPGTGKSAFGHWLAREIDRPIHVKRASDLLGSYVGQTERQIAESFSEAREDNAILMLDEIDSFLLDRSSAHRSWEITQVNEMLTQIEAYPGILIASTNRLRHLDPASLRRFDLKLEFGYLRTDQAARLLVSHCNVLALAPATPADLARLTTLDNLTPGDFAAVSRRHRFSPLGTAACFVAELATECDLKTEQVRRIGFAG
jgi:SpoVK/Ycf46/Vps4 family AAA+-type ATPase